MNLKQLQYFLVVAEEHQITAASKRLNIAQPPLSYQLKKLEKNLNVQLFKRTARGIELTDAGCLLEKYARQIIELTELTENKVRKIDQDNLAISLGVDLLTSAILPEKQLQQFHKLEPRVNFDVYEDNAYDIIEKIKRRQLDLAIIRTPFNSDGLDVEYLTNEQMVAVFPKVYKIDNIPQEIDVTILSRYPLIIYRSFQTLFRSTFMQYGVEPNMVVQCENARMAIDWAKTGFGIAIVPESIAWLEKVDYVAKIDCEEWETKMALIWGKGRRLTPILKEFVEQFKELNI